MLELSLPAFIFSSPFPVKIEINCLDAVSEEANAPFLVNSNASPLANPSKRKGEYNKSLPTSIGNLKNPQTELPTTPKVLSKRPKSPLVSVILNLLPLPTTTTVPTCSISGT